MIMDKPTKGLADKGEGEFILNESGTSVSTDPVAPMIQQPQIQVIEEREENTEKKEPQEKPVK